MATRITNTKVHNAEENAQNRIRLWEVDGSVDRHSGHRYHAYLNRCMFDKRLEIMVERASVEEVASYIFKHGRPDGYLYRMNIL